MVSTLSNLRDQVRQRLNIENATHITDAELSSYLNYSLAELYELVTESNEDWNVIRLSFDMNSTDDGYVLPSNFWKPLRIDRMITSASNISNFYTLHRINIRDESLYGTQFIYYNATVNGYNTEVNSSGQTVLRVYPTNQQAGSYRVLYYPTWTDLADDGYVIIGNIGLHWEEYAIVDTCIKCCLKDETDPAGYVLQKAAVINRIKAAAAGRDAGQAEPPPQNIKWYDKGRGWGRF